MEIRQTKVFIIHGFEGRPNGGWRPWLMGELDKLDIYACSLSMPTPDYPKCDEWTKEISRHVENNSQDEIYLIGHSLGVPAILRYLETSKAQNIAGAILVSGPSERIENKRLLSFLDRDFDFQAILTKCQKFSIIHGDNDPLVPLDNAEFLAKELNGELIIVKNGGHLNSSAGWNTLPQCLEAVVRMDRYKPHDAE